MKQKPRWYRGRSYYEACTVGATMVTLKGKILAVENLGQQLNRTRAWNPGRSGEGLDNLKKDVCCLSSPWKQNQSFTKAWVWWAVSPFSSSAGQSIAPTAGWTWTETALDYWSLGAGLVAHRFWVLAFLLGLVGSEATFLLQWNGAEPPGLDETLGTAYLGAVLYFHSSKSCHYTSDPCVYPWNGFPATLRKNPFSSGNNSTDAKENRVKLRWIILSHSNSW